MKYLKAVGLTLLLTVMACERKADLKSDEARYSYAVGHQIGRNMKSQDLKIDTKAFVTAMKQTLEGKDLQMTEKEMREAMRKMSEMRRTKRMEKAQGNKKQGTEYLAKNKSKEGVKVTATGLQYRVLKEGEGAKPKKEDTVKVHYKGTLIDGTEFDSSYKRNRPAEFPVQAVIPGWTEALQLMPVGSKWELVIPSELGYGEMGNPKIPGNSVLIFEVELLDIVKKPDSKVSKAKKKK